jgi:hypothetical protein
VTAGERETPEDRCADNQITCNYQQGRRRRSSLRIRVIVARAIVRLFPEIAALPTLTGPRPSRPRLLDLRHHPRKLEVCWPN